ncbi:hypothetical protein [Endozoicomonas ascidiicola]|uniref:hypothetical protein n=1 Tax=Endozoicomonas ascidiicola TaxID=1698521 RepID=UPI000AC41290|nr:hypothetical protein [Endozoicomonas ascidiicola]
MLPPWLEASVTFPVIADENLIVSKLYGMLAADESIGNGRTSRENYTIRAVFVINNDSKRIEATMTYPMEVGRNLDEIQRLLDALITVNTNKSKVVTGAGWVRGNDLILNPDITDDQGKNFYGSLRIQTLPSSNSGYPDYLRWVPFFRKLQKDHIKGGDLENCGPNSFVSPCHQCSWDGTSCFECSVFTTYDACETHGAHTCAEIAPCGPWCPEARVCDPD